jgi:predicted acetyltransferase
MSALEVRELGSEQEMSELAAILGWAFGSPAADIPAWLEVSGTQNVRVALRGARVCAGLLQIPMGQWFGSQSVPMVGIAAVGVAPEDRGRGVALELMQKTLRELADRNLALSTLYPATQGLYRAVGYEQAGSRLRYSVRPADLPRSERELDVRRIEESDTPAIVAAYRRYASATNGCLDRGDYIWRRVRRPRNEPAQGYLVAAGGELEGYVYLTQRRSERLRYELQATDLVALSSRAGRRLLGLLAEHRSLAERIEWHAGPADPFFTLIPEQAYEMNLAFHHMLRIVDAAAALAARGYPAGVAAELELDVHDDLIEKNSGRFVLSVRNGAGQLVRGGQGRLRVDIRGLAALYSGFLSPRSICRIGLMDGSDELLDTAQTLFAGPPPGMTDHF